MPPACSSLLRGERKALFLNRHELPLRRGRRHRTCLRHRASISRRASGPVLADALAAGKRTGGHSRRSPSQFRFVGRTTGSKPVGWMGRSYERSPGIAPAAVRWDIEAILECHEFRYLPFAVHRLWRRERANLLQLPLGGRFPDINREWLPVRRSRPRN